MGEVLRPSSKSVEKPNKKRKKRVIQSVDHIPTSFSKEQLEELLSSVWIKKIKDSKGGTQWEIVSLITSKNEHPREVRKTKRGALKVALAKIKSKHTHILIKDEAGNVVERIQLRSKK